MEDNLGYGLTNDRGGLGGLLDVSVQVGHMPWGIMGPRTPPRCRSTGMDIVATIKRWKAICTSSVGRPTWKLLDPDIFHTRLVRAALADFEG